MILYIYLDEMNTYFSVMITVVNWYFSSIEFFMYTKYIRYTNFRCYFLSFSIFI